MTTKTKKVRGNLALERAAEQAAANVLRGINHRGGPVSLRAILESLPGVIVQPSKEIPIPCAVASVGGQVCIAYDPSFSPDDQRREVAKAIGVGVFRLGTESSHFADVLLAETRKPEDNEPVEPVEDAQATQ